MAADGIASPKRRHDKTPALKLKVTESKQIEQVQFSFKDTDCRRKEMGVKRRLAEPASATVIASFGSPEMTFNELP